MLPYAVGSACVRCGRPILVGQPVDLDHTDDRTTYLGWSHAACNRRAGARLGNHRRRQRRDARRERINRMLTECALGVEIGEARDHVSIAAAGYMDADFVLVELAAYLDGTDPTAEVLRLRAERTVTAVAVDPHSPGATLVKPLTDAGIMLTQLSTHDVAVAHGEFLDLVASGRLRHSGQPELTAAVRHGTQRRLGGAAAWERRGTAVDISPLTAATWAVWALRNVRRPFVWAEWR
jgi:hypothetical protein